MAETDIEVEVKETSHDKVMQAHHDLYEELGKAPTMIQIAERTALHRTTVSKHLRNMKVKNEIIPKYNLFVHEVIDTHFALMRQKEDLNVALKACLTLEERLYDIISIQQVAVTDQQTKKLIIEIEDTRKQIDNAIHVECEVIQDKSNEDKS